MVKIKNVKERVAVVVSDRMDKTVVVEVEVRKRHRLYGKIVLRKSKYYVDDPENLCKVGNIITIVERRPVSKTKRWFVKEIISKDVIDITQSSDDDDLGLDDKEDESSAQLESIKNDQDIAEKEAPTSEEAGESESKS